MKKMELSPSMMCVDFANIGEAVKEFEQAGVEYLHVDIMDGEFVPNFTLGVDFCKKLRQMTNIPLDIHLMIEKPEEKLEWFEPQPGEIVSVHWESTVHMQRLLAKIRNTGAKPMVALNPATPLSVLEEITDDLDGVLVMTVNPGYAGQMLVPAALEKIKKVRRFLDKKGKTDADIEVDGNVSFEHAVEMKAEGANIFVGGSSSIFSKEAGIQENIIKMRQMIG